MKPDEREKYKGNDAVHVLPLSRTASWMTQALDRPKRGASVSP